MQRATTTTSEVSTKCFIMIVEYIAKSYHKFMQMQSKTHNIESCNDHLEFAHNIMHTPTIIVA